MLLGMSPNQNASNISSLQSWRSIWICCWIMPMASEQYVPPKWGPWMMFMKPYILLRSWMWTKAKSFCVMIRGSQLLAKLVICQDFNPGHFNIWKTEVSTDSLCDSLWQEEGFVEVDVFSILLPFSDILIEFELEKILWSLTLPHFLICPFLSPLFVLGHSLRNRQGES